MGDKSPKDKDRSQKQKNVKEEQKKKQNTKPAEIPWQKGKK